MGPCTRSYLQPQVHASTPSDPHPSGELALRTTMQSSPARVHLGYAPIGSSMRIGPSGTWCTWSSRQTLYGDPNCSVAEHVRTARNRRYL